MTIQFVRNTVVNSRVYYTNDIVSFAAADETTQVSSGNAVSYPIVPIGSVVYFDRTMSIDNLQSLHDALKANGGGTIVFQGGATYQPKTSVTLDPGYVGIDFGWSKIDLSAFGNGNRWMTITATDITGGGSDRATMSNRAIERAWIIGASNSGDSQGPTAFYLNTAGVATNRILFRQMKFYAIFKGLEFGSGSPFVTVYDTLFDNCIYPVYQNSGATNFAEKNTFINCVFGNGDYHLYDAGGNLWRFLSCSFDYHNVRAFVITQGCKVWCRDCHIEWNYGATAGQTNEPVLIQNANSCFIFKGGAIVYTGSGQNPLYPSFISANNSSQKINIECDKMVKMGRLTDTLGFDALALTAASGSQPQMRCILDADGVGQKDLPSMTAYTDMIGGVGTGGRLRSGVDQPYNELVHRIGLTGTAAISSVSADENGMTRKNGAPCIKITGAGKVLISLPVLASDRRHAWCLFYNAVFVTGTVTIKERQTGWATKFDGTNMTLTADTRGAAYSGTTVTLGIGSNTWTRCSWSDCNNNAYPSPRQDIATGILIEIDTTSMSAGAVYLSHFGFDLL